MQPLNSNAATPEQRAVTCHDGNFSACVLFSLGARISAHGLYFFIPSKAEELTAYVNRSDSKSGSIVLNPSKLVQLNQIRPKPTGEFL